MIADVLKLTNDELNLKVKALANKERKLAEEILQHIAEVDHRKLFLIWPTLHFLNISPKKLAILQVLRKEKMALIRQAQEILSHQTKGSLKEMLLLMAKKTLKASQDSQIPTPPHQALKSVTPKLKKFIHLRDQSCQFKDLGSEKICGSKYFLDVDHITPKFANGSNAPENLRILCRNHNQYRYKAEFEMEFYKSMPQEQFKASWQLAVCVCQIEHIPKIASG